MNFNRSKKRQQLLVVCIAAALCLGGKCGGGSGGGGGKATIVIESPDDRCTAVGGAFPPGFGFVGIGALLWVVDFPATLVPFDVSEMTPQAPMGLSPFAVPLDSDADGRADFPLRPVLDDIEIESPELALVTASSYEEVLFFQPDTGTLRSFDVSVAASFEKSDNIFLPDPGTTESRTGLSTFACVRPPDGALDSRGDPIAVSVPAAGFCDAAIPSYRSSFTSGARIVGTHMFVSSSNLGDDPGTMNTQYLPGSVEVYDIELASDPPTVEPNEGVPVILTTGFNPSHVTRYEVGSRRFALITVTGALGIVQDDPKTDEVEAFGLPLTEAAIDVVDADTLEVVASYPLGLSSPSTAGVTIDPTGRIGVVGSSIDRALLAIDLAPLESLPGTVVQPVDLASAVIFDAENGFPIPARIGGASEASCPGFVSDAAFDANTLYATEACDGTIAVIDVDLSGDPPVPVPSDRFTVVDLIPFASPVSGSTLGDRRQPGAIAVRPGPTGTGPEVVFLVGDPDGEICGIDAN
jgi:hypothetical protein